MSQVVCEFFLLVTRAVKDDDRPHQLPGPFRVSPSEVDRLFRIKDTAVGWGFRGSLPRRLKIMENDRLLSELFKKHEAMSYGP